jgi:hypothetical protein
MGWWTLPNFPERVTMNARSFRKAWWRQPYDGVVEQYREEQTRNSMHLKVYGDGRWVVDHIDEDNPDLGRPVEHFFSDHPVGKFIKVAAPVAGVALGLFLVLRAVSRS